MLHKDAKTKRRIATTHRHNRFLSEAFGRGGVEDVRNELEWFMSASKLSQRNNKASPSPEKCFQEREKRIHLSQTVTT
jgi:hypothetical protein